MSRNDKPVRRDEAEMIAESRLDYMLDAVEAPEAPAALRHRLYGIADGARAAVRAEPLWQRIGAWFSTGPVLRPAALACTLALGVALGYTLHGDGAPEAAGPDEFVLATQAPAPPQTLVVAGLADASPETEATLVDSINLVAPPAAQTGGDIAEDDGGDLPLY